jgi:hypothetical protein
VIDLPGWLGCCVGGSCRAVKAIYDGNLIRLKAECILKLLLFPVWLADHQINAFRTFADAADDEGSQ